MRVLRTACDIACLRGRFRALATIDQFRRAFGLTERDFLSMLPRYKGRRGVIQLRELIPLSTDRADSPAESWVRLMIHDAGLPRPEPQVWAELMSLGPVRMENAYAHLRIAVEYDGEEDHTREEDREHDSTRRSALRRELDWYIIVVRKGQLSARAREEWLRELRREIESRTPYRPGKRVYSRGPDRSTYPRRRRKRSA